MMCSLGVVPIVSMLSEYAQYLQTEREIPKPYRIRRLRDPDQWAVDVFPTGIDALLFGGFKGELYISPGYGVTQGKTLEKIERETEPGVALVLGAGNQFLLTAIDTIHALIMQSRVVVCKMNPVNEYMGPYLRRALMPLVDAGYLEFVYGAEEEGKYLVNHHQIKSIHLTGSAETFDAIVWQGKAKIGSPPLQKPVSAELGCVTPYVVVPGEWTQSDIEYQASAVVSAIIHNNGHNCLAAEVIITDKAWPQREEFINAVRRHLQAAPQRSAYYPGTENKWNRFKKRYPDAEELGTRELSTSTDIQHFPWLLKCGLSSEESSVSEENWCGVAQEVCINSGETMNVGNFLKLALEFMNEECWGTLSCAVIADPSVQKKYKNEFDHFIHHLKYGSVCINVNTIVGYGITKLCWGAWGEREYEESALNIGTGNCKVHNTMFFDHVEKAVIHGPWKFHPYPYWLCDHRNAEKVGEYAAQFMANKSFITIGKMLPEAFLG